MSNHTDTIAKTINSLCESTRMEVSSTIQVKQAFILGLWWNKFPEYMLGHLGACHAWDLTEIDPDLGGNWGEFDKRYRHIFKFMFISDTGDSWHQCYRDLRLLGWRRTKVHRAGGNLQYVFEITHDEMPKGYSKLHLLLQIAISTCRQVQVGTEMKEVPIMKTVCEDLVDEPEEDSFNGETPEECVVHSAEVTSLTVIDDIAKYEAEHGPEGQIPTVAEFKDDAVDGIQLRQFPQCAHGYFPGQCVYRDCVYYGPPQDDSIPF